MKYIAILIASILLFSFDSDNGILFKVRYHPQTRYSETIEQKSLVTLKYQGDKAILKKLKEKGVKNPTITNKSSVVSAEIKTGKTLDGVHFPIRMEFLSTKSSDNKKAIPDGTVFYGKASSDSMPVLDSIYAPGIDNAFKQAVLKSMSSLLSQITFPVKRMIVGDTFTHEVPLSFPMSGVTINMIVTTVYKLVSIDKGIANFDIAQVYHMKIKEYKTEGRGIGNGKLKYDIANNFYSYFTESSKMTLKTKTNGITINVSSKNSFTQDIKIIPE